jgi:hypothetical protein
MMRWAWHVTHMRRDKKYIQNFGLKTWRERPLGRHRYRWEDNIRMDLREIGWEVMDWMHNTDSSVFIKVSHNLN